MNRSVRLVFILGFWAITAGAEPLAVRDTDGNEFLFPAKGKKAAVLFFADVQCPEANRYLAKIEILQRKYESRGVDVLVVYPGSYPAWTVARHINDRELNTRATIDYDWKFFAQYKPKVFSETVVLNAEGHVAYQGRYDDQYSTAQHRPQAKTSEVEGAIDSLLRGEKPAVTAFPASGCPIGKYKRKPTAKLTYTKHIAPLFKKYCSSCHLSGDDGVISLETYEDVKRLAPAIRAALSEYRMPPWHLDTEPQLIIDPVYLPEPDRRKIIDWIDTGAKRGVGKELPWPHPPDGWQIGKPDRIIELPVAQKVPATGPGLFYEFTMDLKNDKDLWIKKFQVLPEQKKALHHLMVFLLKKGAKTPDELSNGRSGVLLSYQLGSRPTFFAKGLARRIPPGYELYFSVHYNPIGVEVVDRTKIGLVFSKEPPKREAFTDSVYSFDLKIPPGRRFHKITAEQMLDRPIVMDAAMLHAHYRGRSMRFLAELPDGTQQEIISAPKFSFGWQFVYIFKKYFTFPKGTKLKCEALYDNSDRNPVNPNPRATVSYGLKAEDEMLHCFYDYFYP